MELKDRIKEKLNENFKGYGTEAKMYRHVYLDLVKVDNYLKDLSKEKDFKEAIKKFKESLSKDLKFITFK